MEELIGDSFIFNGKGRVSNLFESQPFELHFTITKHFWLVSAKRKIRLDHMKLPTRQYYPSVYIIRAQKGNDIRRQNSPYQLRPTQYAMKHLLQ